MFAGQNLIALLPWSRASWVDRSPTIPRAAAASSLPLQMGLLSLSSIVATVSVLPATLAVVAYKRHHPLVTYTLTHAAIAGFAVATAASQPLAEHTTSMLGKVPLAFACPPFLALLSCGASA